MFYRREGETSWKALKSGMSDQILVWDTTSVPNGRYTVRIVASDTPSNWHREENPSRRAAG
jgi:hypothetical protein